MDKINITIVGDAGLGKTSLIQSFVFGRSQQRHQSKRQLKQSMEAMLLKESGIVIPIGFDESIPVEMHIYDSSAGFETTEDRLSFTRKMQISNVLIILYNASCFETIRSLSERWLPMARKLCRNEEKDARIVLVDVGKAIAPWLVDDLKVKYPEIKAICHCNISQSINLANNDVRNIFLCAAGVAVQCEHCPFCWMLEMCSTSLLPHCSHHCAICWIYGHPVSLRLSLVVLSGIFWNIWTSKS